MENDNLTNQTNQANQTGDPAQSDTGKKPKKAAEKEKMVKVLLPLMENGDMEQYVAVNGRSFLIRRGEEVEVPECVAEVLRLSEKQKREAYRYQQEAIRRGAQGGSM